MPQPQKKVIGSFLGQVGKDDVNESSEELKLMAETEGEQSLSFCLHGSDD